MYAYGMMDGMNVWMMYGMNVWNDGWNECIPMG